jgi:hypothetical protein
MEEENDGLVEDGGRERMEAGLKGWELGREKGRG